MRLIYLEYEDDAERKRIDYLIEKWKNRAEISKLKGLSILVDDSVSGFLNELYARLNPGSLKRLKIYRISEETPFVENESASFTVETVEKPEIANRILNLVLSKINARKFSENKFFVLTKNGRVDIEVGGKGNKFQFTVTGQRDTVRKFTDKLRKELEAFLGGGNVV